MERDPQTKGIEGVNGYTYIPDDEYSDNPPYMVEKLPQEDILDSDEAVTEEYSVPAEDISTPDIATHQPRLFVPAGKEAISGQRLERSAPQIQKSTSSSEGKPNVHTSQNKTPSHYMDEVEERHYQATAGIGGSTS